MPINPMATIVSMSLGLLVANANAQIIRSTNFGLGADAEVRESNPTQNRGSSTELASRVLDQYSPGDGTGFDSFDRNSVMFLQFDLAGLNGVNTNGTQVRLTYRNNNMAESRIHDTDGMFADFGQNGLEYFGIPGTSFDEDTITYNTAPGMTPDGDVGTKDFNASAVALGSKSLGPIGSQNHLPVGGEFLFVSAALDSFLANEIASNPSGVAVIAVVHRNLGQSYVNMDATKMGQEPPLWTNFNYLFNPKEQVTLGSDTTYDADINDDGNPLGSPWSGADNSMGDYSPQLIIVPSPPASLLSGVVFLPLCRRRR